MSDEVAARRNELDALLAKDYELQGHISTIRDARRALSEQITVAAGALADAEAAAVNYERATLSAEIEPAKEITSNG